MDTSTKLIQDNIITVLVRLDSEAKKPGTSVEEFGKHAFAITKLLNKVTDDFGDGVMLKLFGAASKQAGHTIGPLEQSIVKKLVGSGLEITKIGKVAYYKRN